MRYLSIFVLWFLPSVVVAGELLTPRPLDPIAAETFARALSRSAVVRSLVAALEQSNVIVHIESSMQMPAGIVGMTRFVTSRGGYRYVRITIGSDLSKTARTAILGHELQHACEVAESGADDIKGMRRLFTLEGHRTGDYYETVTALQTEKKIRTELREKSVTARSAVPGK